MLFGLVALNGWCNQLSNERIVKRKNLCNMQIRFPPAKAYIPFHEWDGYTSGDSQFPGNMSHLIALAHDTPRRRKFLRFTVLFWNLCGSEFWKKRASTIWKLNGGVRSDKKTLDFLFGSICHHSLFVAMAPNNAASSWICAAVASSLVCTDKKRCRKELRWKESHHLAVAHLYIIYIKITVLFGENKLISWLF